MKKITALILTALTVFSLLVFIILGSIPILSDLLKSGIVGRILGGAVGVALLLLIIKYRVINLKYL